MRKILLATLVICMLALLSTLSMSVHATPPTTVLGTFDYTVTITGTKEAGTNTFTYATEHEVWSGDFAGEADSVFTVVRHYTEGFMNVEILGTFAGTVHLPSGDKSGTMVLRLVGKRPVLVVTDHEDPSQWWSGQWVILSGTGDLANLCGQGTWWGPGRPGPGQGPWTPHIWYSGQIHFDPA